MSKNYHFIAIGGSVMHSLAIELKNLGNRISGSDDAIYGNSEKKLKEAGLLPEKPGWFPEKITRDLDAVIIGMHAQKDNPEVLKAMEMGVPCLSFPDFIFELAKNKQRIVVGGSHGKTTISAMIVHVLNQLNIPVDYLIGAPVTGLDNQVKISEAPIIVIEGDEYLSSPNDPSPKFLKYHHHIGIISGIDWDHANVFPAEDQYIRQFELFAEATPKAGTIIFPKNDKKAYAIGSKEREDVNAVPYDLPKYETVGNSTVLINGKERYPLMVFGEHNLLNIAAAKAVVDKMGVDEALFYEAISSFEGAKSRLELIYESEGHRVFKDFAHSPSKVRASVNAVSSQYEEKLVAILELHTFSSLDKDFVCRYKESMKKAQKAVVYFNPSHKSVKNMVDKAAIEKAFAHNDLTVFDNKEELHQFLKDLDKKNRNFLYMSSGDFGGLDIVKI